MFLVIFGFDLSVALRCTDEVPCNYVTTSTLCPLQMHHTHPGTINLCAWLYLTVCTLVLLLSTFYFLYYFRRTLKETSQMHALVSMFGLSWRIISITPNTVSPLQHAVASTCICMWCCNMQSMFNNDCTGVKCSIVLPCTDVYVLALI